MSKDQRHLINDTAKVTGVVLALASIAALFIAAFQIFLLVFAAFMLMVFFLGIAEFIQRKLHVSMAIAKTISSLSVLIIAALLFYLLGSNINAQWEEFERKVPQALEKISGALRDMGISDEMVKNLKDNPEEFLRNQQDKISQFFSSTFGIISNLFIIIVISIFFYASPGLYRSGIVHLIPKNRRAYGEETLDKLYITLKSWLLGKLLSMLIVGILITIGLAVAGVPLAMTLGLIAALLTFIPNIGPLIAIIPAALIALLEGFNLVLYVVVLNVVVQVVEANLITPFIQKKMVRMPPAMIFIAQLLLGLLAGGLGLIFATPLMAAFMVLVQMLYIRPFLKDYSIPLKGQK